MIKIWCEGRTWWDDARERNPKERIRRIVKDCLKRTKDWEKETWAKTKRGWRVSKKDSRTWLRILNLWT